MNQTTWQLVRRNSSCCKAGNCSSRSGQHRLLVLLCPWKIDNQKKTLTKSNSTYNCIKMKLEKTPSWNPVDFSVDALLQYHILKPWSTRVFPLGTLHMSEPMQSNPKLGAEKFKHLRNTSRPNPLSKCTHTSIAQQNNCLCIIFG